MFIYKYLFLIAALVSHTDAQMYGCAGHYKFKPVVKPKLTMETERTRGIAEFYNDKAILNTLRRQIWACQTPDGVQTESVQTTQCVPFSLDDAKANAKAWSCPTGPTDCEGHTGRSMDVDRCGSSFNSQRELELTAKDKHPAKQWHQCFGVCRSNMLRFTCTFSWECILNEVRQPVHLSNNGFILTLPNGTEVPVPQDGYAIYSQPDCTQVLVNPVKVQRMGVDLECYKHNGAAFRTCEITTPGPLKGTVVSGTDQLFSRDIRVTLSNRVIGKLQPDFYSNVKNVDQPASIGDLANLEGFVKIESSRQDRNMLEVMRSLTDVENMFEALVEFLAQREPNVMSYLFPQFHNKEALFVTEKEFTMCEPRTRDESIMRLPMCYDAPTIEYPLSKGRVFRDGKWTELTGDGFCVELTGAPTQLDPFEPFSYREDDVKTPEISGAVQGWSMNQILKRDLEETRSAVHRVKMIPDNVWNGIFGSPFSGTAWALWSNLGAPSATLLLVISLAILVFCFVRRC